MYCTKCGTYIDNGNICPECKHIIKEDSVLWENNTLFKGIGLRVDFFPMAAKFLLLLDVLSLGYRLLFFADLVETQDWISRFLMVYRTPFLVAEQMGTMRPMIIPVIYMVIFALRIISMAVLLAMAGVRLFEKSGFKGWKALIPFYNFSYYLRIANSQGWFLTTGAIAIAFCMGVAISGIRGDSLSYAAIISTALCAVLYIVFVYKFCKRFNCGYMLLIGLFMPGLLLLYVGWGARTAKDLNGQETDRKIGIVNIILCLLIALLASIYVKTNTNTDSSIHEIIAVGLKESMDSVLERAGIATSEEKTEEQEKNDTETEIDEREEDSEDEQTQNLSDSEETTSDQDNADYGTSSIFNSGQQTTTAKICPVCGGTGMVYSDMGTVCGICGGTGQQYIPNMYYDQIMGWTGGYMVCGGCGGSGRIGGGYVICSNCGGTGVR